MVGHIDHGKSTLIGRLLMDTDSLPDGKLEEIEAAAQAEGRELEFGFITDHLREERERAMTIDTAQAFFSSHVRDYVIIDAPGHKEFIKNMITGASQAAAAVLICSAAEGIQEQSRRHAYILRLLGIEQVIVAYNKMDLVGYSQERFRAVKQDMDDFLARLGVEPAIEVPISARYGDNVVEPSANMAWYKGPAVLEALDCFKKIPPPTAKPLRFPVQDVYEWPETGRIVAGRVESGTLLKGQCLRFLPGDELRTVRQIRQFGKGELAAAQAGQCIGVLLDGDGLRRGQVGCPEGDGPFLTSRFRASVFWLGPSPLDLGAGSDALTFKCATQEEPCRAAAILDRIDSSTLEHLPCEEGRLEHAEVGELSIETATAVVVESFYDVQELGRFVLVKGRDVVAGGIVTRPAG
jgi:sulfate adenylyltransferase subunit 1 (EFTu-like GTPase family)